MKRCRATWTLAVFAGLIINGCDKPAPAQQPPPPTQGDPPRFELVCDSSDTTTQSSIFCMRHDTQTGDVKLVDIDQIPKSSGSIATANKYPGTFTLTCHATRTETESNLYCIRLNVQTGEMLLVALPKLGVLPEGDTPEGVPHGH